MNCLEFLQNSAKLLILGVLLVCGLSSIAQISDETTANLDEPKLPAGIEILNDQEAEAYQIDRYEQISVALTRSKLTDANQDLLADSLSKSYIGIPVGSFRVDEIRESTLSAQVEHSETLAVLDTAHTEKVNDKSTPSTIGLKETPFSYPEGIPINPASGRVLDETEAEITFRFKVDAGFLLSSLDGSPIQLPKGLFQIDRL